MPSLILLRHLQSQWNLENRFTGWVDVPLSRGGTEQARGVASKLSGSKIDAIYTSPLIRNMDSVLRIVGFFSNTYPLFIHLEGRMEKAGLFQKKGKESFIPVFVTERLNERKYGRLQGLNKDEMREKYGPEKVRLWRVSYSEAPPGGESLKDVLKRTEPVFSKNIEKDLKAGKNVLVVASHHSLRALVKRIENMSDKEIANLEIPSASMIKYEFDKNLNIENKEIL